MQRLTPGLTVPFFLLACGVLRAQQQPFEPEVAPLAGAAAQGFDCAVPIHTRSDDPGYGVWGAMPDYKASFHDGFTFYPRLGTSRPANLPLAWRTIGASCGAQPLNVATVATPEPTDWRCAFDLGDVTEIYDLRRDGAEQSFVIEHAPADRGALVVRGAITTPLHCAERAPAHQDLVFTADDGVPIIRYGKAIAIDANGKRRDATTSFDDGIVTLTVDAAWVATAAFPVTIDPLTSAQNLGVGSLDITSTDVGAEGESATKHILFCTDRAFSASDHDVYAARLAHAQFANPVLIAADLNATWDDHSPSTAFVAGSDRWLVGFERGPTSGSNDSDLRVLFHDKGNTTFGSGVAVTFGSTEWEHDPDVGGTFSGTFGSTALIAFERDTASTDGPYTKVMACPINATARTFGTAYEVAGGVSVFRDRHNPAVNQAAGTTDGWIVVWEELSYVTMGDDWDVAASRTSTAGTEVGFLQVASGGGGAHLADAAIAGWGGDYILTYERSNDTTSRTGVSLHARQVTWPQAEPTPIVGVERTFSPESPTVSHVQNGGVALNLGVSSTAVAVYTRSTLLGLSFRTSAFVARLGGTGAPVETLTALSGTSTVAALAPTVTYAREDRFPFVYATAETNPTLWGREFLYPADALTTHYGTACGAATIGAGAPYIGNSNYYVSIGGTPANAPFALLIAGAPASVPLDVIGMTGCVFAVDPATVFSVSGAANSFGNGRLDIALPDVPANPGDFYFQIAYVAIGANPLGVVTTDGLHVQIR